MAVVERTEGGYVKGEDKNGNTFYRDPNGHPVKQQSFAASKQQEEYDTVIEQDDDGNITGSRTVRKREREPPTDGPELTPNIRVTATCKAETKDTRGWGSGDQVDADIEISGVFPPGEVPDIDEIMKELRAQASEQLPFIGECDPNIAQEPTREPTTGWDHGEVTIGFEHGKTYSYEVDPEQASITDPKWGGTE